MLQILNLQSFATSAKVAMVEFARFCANSAIATFALVAKLCKFHICNIFAPGKFDANSFFRPVIFTKLMRPLMKHKRSHYI